jgi:hypothetical protein
VIGYFFYGIVKLYGTYQFFGDRLL